MTQELVNLSQSNRSGLFSFNVPQAVPAGLKFVTIEIPLSLANKLAALNTKTVILQSRFATTLGGVYELGNETLWTSPGPGGRTITDPHGNVIVNPNPLIQIGLTDSPGNIRVGRFLQMSADLNSTFSAGLIITLTS